ncbi:alpha/beta hydrolase [Geodermatophilus sp. TF02-6]|uniref:alpha/beta fold hydrolase n=1 Tax=Geodermatophilus sp. TF02-6 TaxID=2250575 RepID=UPI000DE9120B|nr:alpha/beta hydrolase [Geodermatophilus sp. TF02-6]RBY78865.1 alpha/beta hydrolase [Geodermatophilus sp. TF02-6]
MPIRRRCLLTAGLTAVLVVPAGPALADSTPDSGSSTEGSVTEGSVEVDGARIHYQVEGEGEPMVLVHGYPLSGDLFARNRAELAESFQVITPDLPGYGGSETSGQQAEGSVGAYADDVLAVMDDLGVDSAVVGGMSMGGQIVLSMYQQAPERFDGMILIDTTAAPAPPPEAGTWEGVAQVVREQGKQAVPPLVIDEMLTGRTRMDEPELVDQLIGLMDQASTEAYLAGASALATRPDFQPLLPDIAVPTLLLVGLEDHLYPYEMDQQMAAAIPDSDLVVLDGGAHAAIIEQAQPADAAILQWAQEQSLSAAA